LNVDALFNSIIGFLIFIFLVNFNLFSFSLHNFIPNNIKKKTRFWCPFQFILWLSKFQFWANFNPFLIFVLHNLTPDCNFFNSFFLFFFVFLSFDFSLFSNYIFFVTLFHKFWSQNIFFGWNFLFSRRVEIRLWQTLTTMCRKIHSSVQGLNKQIVF